MRFEPGTFFFTLSLVFNMQNMPTAFLESFKLMKTEIANLDSSDPYYPSSNGHGQAYSDGYSDEPLYKPMSVLIPPKDISRLPIVDQHDGYGKVSNCIFKHYVIIT